MIPSFKQYATRVSFNISLSRNQIYVLWSISTQYLGTKHREFGLATDGFIVGGRWLTANGFATWEEKRNPTWQLTEAGEHTLALLKLAGLIPEIAVTNEAA